MSNATTPDYQSLITRRENSLSEVKAVHHVVERANAQQQWNKRRLALSWPTATLRLALLQTIGAGIAFFNESTSNLDASRRENLAHDFRAIDVSREEVTKH